MSESESYRATLSRLKSDLAATEARANKLRAAIAVISEIVNFRVEGHATLTVQNATSKSTAQQPTLQLEPSQEPDPRMAGITMAEGALLALEKEKRPLSIKEIYRTMMSLGYPYTRGFEAFRQSINPTLRRDKRFEKVGRGTFRLLPPDHGNH